MLPHEYPNYLENRRKYLENRPNFPMDELRKHMGKWIAWSADGSRIAASADELEQLYQIIDASGVDPREFILEGIPDCDSVLGGWFGEVPS